ncbi:bacterial alpha-L-rhamnosidase-domain-containing protein [Apiospora rasikravindrae]|uniref:alpha-L-rhamnosidase n=1 Tax=Apiospora rasikravindrae TaxID=990691 RepID=A0ABR1TDI1_9PEZI
MQPLIENLRIEHYPTDLSGHHPTCLGTQHPSPRISWQYRGENPDKPPKNWQQVSYEIQVRRNRSNHQDVFKSTVDSRNNILVPWPGAPLVSRERAQLRVRAYGGRFPNRLKELKTAFPGLQQAWTEWSGWIVVEAALLDPLDRLADFITSTTSTAIRGEDQEIQHIRPILFSRLFSLDTKPGRARLYITAFGVYVALVNHRKVGNECMAPGWTSYNKRLQYQVFDVKDLLVEGENRIDIHVAEGWYAGRLLWGEHSKACLYGDKIGALAQLEIYTAADDLMPELLLCSDHKWSWNESTMRSSSIYDGEHNEVCDQTWIDANLPPWKPVDIIDPFPDVELLATPCPPVRIRKIIKAKRIWESPLGKTLVDFGQNLVGRIQINSLMRDKGHTITIRHAEVLENGELGTRPLRSAKATDTITFRSPKRLTGWSPDDTSEPLTKDSISAQVLHSAVTRQGFFECSNPDLEKLHKNVVWSVRSNFLSVPTDCPQRDERLGWTGDIQVFGPTASFLFDCAGMLSNWLSDLVLDQEASAGVVPFVVPDVLTRTATIAPYPQAVWDDAVVLLPWTIYLYSGDKTLLEKCWYGMRKYIDDIIPRGSDELWNPRLWQLGDWLDPAAPPDDPGTARTDGTLVADAYLVHVTRVMYRISTVLHGETDEVTTRYKEDAKRLVKAFRAKYMTSIGFLAGDTQTSLALALVFGLHNDSDHRGRATAVSRLVRLQGATTIWERWDSRLPNGRINPGTMTSFNHYALGSIATWLYTVIGGLSPYATPTPAAMATGREPGFEELGLNEDVVGWRKIRIQPQPGGDVE